MKIIIKYKGSKNENNKVWKLASFPIWALHCSHMPEIFNVCESACVLVCLGLCVREKFKAPSNNGERGKRQKNSKLQVTMVWEEKEKKNQSSKSQWCERKKRKKLKSPRQQWCKREKRIELWEFLWEWKDLSFMRNNEQIVLSM